MSGRIVRHKTWELLDYLGTTIATSLFEPVDPLLKLSDPVQQRLRIHSRQQESPRPGVRLRRVTNLLRNPAGDRQIRAIRAVAVRSVGPPSRHDGLVVSEGSGDVA